MKVSAVAREPNMAGEQKRAKRKQRDETGAGAAATDVVSGTVCSQTLDYGVEAS